MSKEITNQKWNFVEKRKNTIGQSREDSSFAPFLQNKLRCLVREYIQNSMDAHIDGELFNDPVKVAFSFGNLKCSDYEELIVSLKSRLRACSEYCKKYPNGKDPYEDKLLYLDKCCQEGTIGFLKIADFNTKGMHYVDNEDVVSPFKACVRESSASYKENEHAAGSHGQGKTVGFVNSELNAVYYSTMTREGDTFGEGVIKLCNHKVEDKYFEAGAFYDSHNGEMPDSGTDIPEDFRRTEPGTDAYVLGIDETEEAISIMKKEIIRSFFKAFYDEYLVVDVCGEIFDCNNLNEKLDLYFPESEFSNFDSVRTSKPELNFNPRPYVLEVLNKKESDEDHIIFESDKDFPGQFAVLGHASLIAWKSESIKACNSRDSIVYMRDNSMAIEVKRGKNAKGYYGIVICDGEGSEYLRKMENVTHDKWDEAELIGQKKEIKQYSKKVLNAVKDFVAACENNMFPPETEEEHRLVSLKSRTLGKLGGKNAPDEEDNWPTINIVDEVEGGKAKASNQESSISVRSKKKKKKSGTGTNGEGAGEDTGTGGSEGTEGTGGAGGSGGTGGNSGGSTKGPGGEGGNTGTGQNETSGEEGIEAESEENEPDGKKIRPIILDAGSKHLMPCHDGQFALKLAIRVPKNYYSCSLVLQVQGLSGKMPLELESVSGNLKIGGLFNNEISGFDLQKDQVNIIKFTPKESVKNFTLIISAYGG